MPLILRELRKDDGSPLREIHVDAELRRVLADLLGESLEYIVGAGFGSAFPLDEAKFAMIKERFALDVVWDDADWFAEEIRESPLDP